MLLFIASRHPNTVLEALLAVYIEERERERERERRLEGEREGDRERERVSVAHNQLMFSPSHPQPV